MDYYIWDAFEKRKDHLSEGSFYLTYAYVTRDEKDKIVEDDKNSIWKNPSVESYYLLNRWKAQNKIEFLDLGCGLGRHPILFGKNGFHVHCFDISEEAISRTKEWAKSEELTFEYTTGDMLKLPYKDKSMECILCRNVINSSYHYHVHVRKNG